MRLGSTPKHTFTLPFETDLIQELKITYSQNKKIILEKHLADCEVDKNSVSYKLTQEETFLFTDNVNVELQVRVLTTTGDVLASNIRIVTAERCLDGEVLK